MNNSKEQLLEKFDQLPQDLQDAILAVETSDKLQLIAKKFGLHIDQTGEMGSETGLVMLGITHPTEFIGNLEKRLGVERAKAAQIAGEVNEQIFLPIRDSLKKIHAESEAEVPADVGSRSSYMNVGRPTSDFENRALIGAIENPEMTSWLGSGETRPPLEPKRGGLEVGGPVGEGILPSVPQSSALNGQSRALEPTVPDNLIETQMSGSFSLPKQKTNIVEPPRLNQDPYREQAP